jgi:hypothetical protein
MEQSPFQKLTGFQPVKKFPAFYGTRLFIAAFTRARQLSLSWASSFQSIPPTSHFLKIHLNIRIPPGSPKWPLPLRFPYQNPVYASPPPIRATWLANLILLDLLNQTIFIEQYRSLSSSLCNLLYSLVTSSLLDPNILLNTLFSKT